MFSFLTQCFAARADILLAQRHVAGLAERPATQAAEQLVIEGAAPEHAAPERIPLAA